MSTLHERIVRMSTKPDDQNENGCWIWRGVLTRGYPRMNMRFGSALRMLRAHRVSAALAEVGTETEHVKNLILAYEIAGFECDHLCNDTRCVNPDHLQWLEPKQHYAVTLARRNREPLNADA
jgi:hypothetical protein